MGRPALLALALLAAVACEPATPTAPAPPSLPLPGATPTPGNNGSPSPTPDLGEVQLRLVRVAVLDQPLGMATRPGDDALYVAEKGGRIVALRPGGPQRTVLDLSGEVSAGTEQGLLGLTFSPDGRFLYVNYTDRAGDTRLHEFATTEDGIVPESRREVLTLDQPYSNHNGGHLAFGPDGLLYVGVGDGGSAGDPHDNAQDLGTLLGKMLRIDPRPADGRGYGIPPDNPFTGRDGARPEIWAFGLRNPWRYSFDRETADLWIGDVGQTAREEIDVQPGRSSGGENYGWDAFEGSLPFEPPYPKRTVGPVYDYGRALGATVIGGFVYRGSAIPALRGAYLFGDFYNPPVRALVPANQGFRHVELGIRVDNLVSFGEDQAGELYLISIAGPVYRLTPA